MATPVFECLRASLPRARIIGVMKKSMFGIVKDSPWFDAVVDGNDKSWAGFGHMREHLRSLTPDAAILLTNSLRSALTMRLCGIRQIYGYRRQGRGLLLTGGPTASRTGKAVPIPMLDYYLEICRWLELDLPKQPRPQLFIGDELHRRAESLLAKWGIVKGDFLVGFIPGASFGPSKCWPAESFAELAELCQKRLAAKLILFSGPGEEDVVRAVLGRTKAPIIDPRAEGTDLDMLKPLVKRCNLLIANDTGPRHYAVAFDVPVVVIIGPTDPRYTNANLERTRIVRKELDCSPCHKRVCPRQHECMKEIRPTEVLAAAEQLVRVHR